MSTYDQLCGAVGLLKQDGAELNWPALNEQLRDLARRLDVAQNGDPATGLPAKGYEDPVHAEIKALHRTYRDMCLARNLVRVGELFNLGDCIPLYAPGEVEERESPFKKYRHILLHEDYSVAGSLQQFTLSLFNGADVQFRADRLSNYDDNHFAIFIEMARHYHIHGENDEEFMRVCREMWAQRKALGRKCLAELAAHRATDPKGYDEGEHAWHNQLRWLENHVEDLRAKGWIDPE